MIATTPQPGVEMLFGNAPVGPVEIVHLLTQVNEDAVAKYLKVLNPSYSGDPAKTSGGWKEVIFRTLKAGLVDKYGGQEVCAPPQLCLPGAPAKHP